MLSHDNLTYNAAACATILRCDHRENIVRYSQMILVTAASLTSLCSYLPLSHIAAQLVDIHGVMFLGGHVWFAQPDALKVCDAL